MIWEGVRPLDFWRGFLLALLLTAIMTGGGIFIAYWWVIPP